LPFSGVKRLVLVHGGHRVTDEDSDLGRIRWTLSQDFEAIDPWLLPIEGGMARDGRRNPQMQSAR
jgi:hypothetical protein